LAAATAAALTTPALTTTVRGPHIVPLAELALISAQLAPDLQQLWVLALM